jgi:alginate biosynthesis protein AlgX
MADISRAALRTIVMLVLGACALKSGSALAQPAGSTPLIACDDAYEGGKRSDYFETPLYQGDDGWFFRYSADLTDMLLMSPDAVAKMARINQILASRGVSLIYLPVPTRGFVAQEHVPANAANGVLFDSTLAMRSHEEFVASFRKAGIETVDVASALKSDPPQDQVFLARDLHWTPEGARWVASQVRKVFDKQKDYASLAKVKFDTAVSGKRLFNSKMHEALAGVCGTGDGMPENVTTYETKRAGATADDLLGDESAVSPIALVGTSFSDTQIFNFEGFLSEALESEVANYSVSGGGQFTSIYKWAVTEGQKAELPKFLVWELPMNNRLDGPQHLIMFRQIIAALHGACVGQGKVLPVTEISVDPGQAQRFEIPADLNLSGEDVMLRFSANGQNLERLGLELDYSGGESELLNLVQPERAGAVGSFQLGLSDEFEGKLTGLTVRGLSDTQLTLKLEICDYQKVKS